MPHIQLGLIMSRPWRAAFYSCPQARQARNQHELPPSLELRDPAAIAQTRHFANTLLQI